MRRLWAWYLAYRCRRTGVLLERAADRAIRKGATNRQTLQYLYERAAARTPQEDLPWLRHD